MFGFNFVIGFVFRVDGWIVQVFQSQMSFVGYDSNLILSYQWDIRSDRVDMEDKISLKVVFVRFGIIDFQRVLDEYFFNLLGIVLNEFVGLDFVVMCGGYILEWVVKVEEVVLLKFIGICEVRLLEVCFLVGIWGMKEVNDVINEIYYNFDGFCIIFIEYFLDRIFIVGNLVQFWVKIDFCGVLSFEFVV